MENVWIICSRTGSTLFPRTTSSSVSSSQAQLILSPSPSLAVQNNSIPITEVSCQMLKKNNFYALHVSSVSSAYSSLYRGRRAQEWPLEDAFRRRRRLHTKKVLRIMIASKRLDSPHSFSLCWLDALQGSLALHAAPRNCYL